MHIKPGDGFRLTNGHTVRVASVFNVYEAFDTEEHTGTDPTTHVRYSRYWIEGQILFPEQAQLSEFMSLVAEPIPVDELPDKNRPGRN